MSLQNFPGGTNTFFLEKKMRFQTFLGIPRRRKFGESGGIHQIPHVGDFIKPTALPKSRELPFTNPLCRGLPFLNPMKMGVFAS